MRTAIWFIRTLVIGLAASLGAGGGFAAADTLLVEAEQFSMLGGWDLDQQSMDQMGSPYLLAHGLGVPVADATTRVTFPAAGTYHVWVRTRDWVAPWNAPGAPGRFQVVVDGVPLDETFGTTGAEWHWQPGGTVTVGREATLALHDLTGFEGRCDAILFSTDPKPVLPNADPEMVEWRRKLLGLQEQPEDGGQFDLVVVGGGVAGTAAALSAARNGLTVALIQDRPVLGGNGSSEVRVWPEGHTCQEPFPHVGEIVEELCPPKGPGDGNAKRGAIYADDRKLVAVRAEPRITLFLEHRVNAVEADAGLIRAVTAQSTRSARRVSIRGRLFADCTGDATVGYLAGADYEISNAGLMGASNLWNVLDQANQTEVLGCECKDKEALTVQTEAGQVAAPFPRLEWALDLTDKPFPGRASFTGQWAGKGLAGLGGWFWESGFGDDPFTDLERIRDRNLRAMYGAWDALKNTDGKYANHRLGWSAFIAGKRESRRLLGDVILTVKDFKEGRQFPDPAFPNTWHIDIHEPHPEYSQGLTGDEFISICTTGKEYRYKGPYWAPYRCLYSRNVGNLFMAGRDISVEREALGPVRVMRTCGMMGEIVGKAAWICVRHDTSPRGVYEQHLDLLQNLMRQPGASRRPSLTGELVLSAAEVAPHRPNVVILYADDMGYGDLAANNPDSKIPTPNLDRLAAEGMRFTDAHSSSGICTPSRYALLTGRHHWRDFHGIVGSFGASVFKPGQLTLPEMLRRCGYDTACVGKWHLGWDWDAIRHSGTDLKSHAHADFDWSRPIPDGPLAHGFDRYFGDDVINFPPYAWIENDRVVEAPDTTLERMPGRPKEGEWECRPGPARREWDPYQVLPKLTDRAVDFVRSRRGDPRPFLLYFPLPSPHAPIVPTDAFARRSGAGPFGDYVVQTDDACGRVLAALHEADLESDTVVIFSSDNGPEIYAYARDAAFDHWSAAPFRGLKRDLYEGGHHVPFLLKWPGVTQAGAVSDALVSQVDLMATLADAIDFELPPDAAADSHDLFPWLTGRATEPPRHTIVHNTAAGRYAIRHDAWLLVDGDTGVTEPRKRSPPAAWTEKHGYPAEDGQPTELYDLREDAGQRHNLAADRPEQVSELRDRLERIRHEERSAPR